MKKMRCAFADCDQDKNHDGMWLTNTKRHRSFSEMAEEESMHIECYLRHCIRKFIAEETEKAKR